MPSPNYCMLLLKKQRNRVSHNSHLGRAAGQILIDGIWSEVISISPFISVQMSEGKESSEGR